MKKCPRCGEKCLEVQKRCDGCGLIFDRLKYASNKKAKECIAKGRKHEVIRTTDFPQDLSRKKALLYSGFLGLLGVHNFYVGRYVKGFFSLIVIFISALCILLEGVWDYTAFYENFFFIPASISLIFWVLDFIAIALHKYKVPIALDFGGDI